MYKKTLRQLLSENNIQDLLPFLVKLHKKVSQNVIATAYTRVKNELLALEGKPSSRLWCILVDEKGVVCGVGKSEVKGLEKAYYSIAYSDWNELIDLPVKSNLEETKTLAHILWEIIY